MNWSAGIRAAALAVTLTVAAQAEAQQTDADLRSARDAALQQMLADPADTDLMLEFARLSVRLREFEPAISTLERYLDQKPGDLSAIYELGVAYFALGAYEVAELHLRQVAEASGVSDGIKTKVAAYREEIAARTSSAGLRGRIEAGIAYSTNAALQASNNTVLTGGVPLTRLPGTGPEEALGATLKLRLDHRYDLDTAFGEFWHTEATLQATHFADQSDGDYDGVLIRSGPMLSLNEFAFGPKLRPYVEVDTFFAAQEWSASTLGVGAQYHDTFNAEWSMFANARAGWRLNDGSDNDGAVLRGVLGTTWRPIRDVRVRLAGMAETDLSSDDAVANTLWAVRTGMSYDFDSGLEIASRKWRAGAYAQYQGREFDGPDPAISPTITRSDQDVRLGASLRAHLQDGFFVTGNVDWLSRQSNIPQFDGRELLLRLSAGFDF